MSGGLFFLFLLVLVVVAYVGWIVYSRHRAQKSGIPPPPFKSFVPFTAAWRSSSTDSTYPSPRSDGIVGWFKAQFARLTNRRTHRGAYEDVEGRPLGYGRTRDQDEIWDSSVGMDGGAPGYYEEQELGTGPAHASRSPYTQHHDGDSYVVKDSGELERGRSRSRDPKPQGAAASSKNKNVENPFGDNAESSTLRAVSPRPEQNAGRIERSRSPGDRRSAFSESL